MPKYIEHKDLTGMIFGHWKVLKFLEIKNSSEWVYECQCDCPNQTVKPVYERNLLKGKSLKCGKKGCFNPSPPNKRTFNDYEEQGAITKIFYKSFVCTIDTEDLVKISSTSWRVSTDKNNDIRWTGSFDNKISAPITHALISCPKGFVVDHINGDTSDNRKENLRVVTERQNRMNTKTFISNTSGCKGVSKSKGKYIAYINYKKRKISLGAYLSFEEAQYARFFGEKILYKEHSSYFSRNLAIPKSPHNKNQIETNIIKTMEERGLL